MPYSQSAIHLGDLARALETLEPANEKTRLSIAMKLGLHWDPPQTRKKPLPEKPLPVPPPPVGVDTKPIFPTSKPSSTPVASHLEHTRGEDTATSIYVPPLESSASEDGDLSPPLEPLFFPRWMRGILSAALATESATGPLDVERIVKTLASGMCLKELPMLSSPTLTRGVQLLIDRSLAMLPFIGDQVRLSEEILRVVGKDRVTTLRFVGCPSRGAGAGAQMNWSQYEPPLYGTPVLLLTDLGIGRPRLSDERAGVAEWLTFARLVEKAKCPLLAFVPYAASRWPKVLTQHLTIIQWDRKTTATTVRNKMKNVREVSS
jgi:hypothetical protein